ERQKQVGEARQAYDGQRVLDLLADVPPDYPNLEALRDWAHAEIRRRKELEDAQAAYDGRRVLNILERTPADYPQVDTLRRWAEEWIAREQALDEAWNAGRWEEVLSLLNSFPPDYPDRDRRLQEAGKALWQQQRLEEIRAAFAGARWDDVVALCEQAIAEGGDPAAFAEWRDRARQEQETDREVARLAAEADTAAQAGDLQRALSLVDQALALRPDRPDLRQRRADLQAAIERERRLEQAQRAFAEARWPDVLVLLADWPPDDPRGEPLRREAHERLVADLQAQADALEAAENWEAALGILRYLQTLQGPDEVLEERVRRVEREFHAAQVLARARRAGERGRWEEALALAQEALRLSPDHPEARSLQERAR
ncbi:MAG: hypothetical protein ACK4WK_11320, partial [Anaerolineae bacterium]